MDEELDFFDIVPEYWDEYLTDMGSNEKPNPMSALEEVYKNSSVQEIMEDAVWGYSFKGESFDPYEDFFAYSKANNGHLISISEDDLPEYILSIINEKHFMDWYEKKHGSVNKD